MSFLKVDRSLYSQRCSLVWVSDTVDATETILHRDIECSTPFPIGKEHMERSFHHTPDIGMGDAGKRYVIYLKCGNYTPTPAMRVMVEGLLKSYGIRAINDWIQTEPQFHEILLELP
jgi:hypothetical protein